MTTLGGGKNNKRHKAYTLRGSQQYMMKNTLK